LAERLVNLTWDEAEKRLREARVAILPLGSCEQHGYHLPLGTDTTMAERISERVAELVGGIVLPVVPYGQVWSAKHFPGTISLRSSTLKSVLTDVCISLERHGVKAVAFISGHLGNLSVVKECARDLLDICPKLQTMYFCYPDYKNLAKGIMETKLWNESVFHAGEIETSLMLAVDPDSCRMDRAIADFPPVPEKLEYTPMFWHEFNRSGVFGDATAATAEKGSKYFDRLTSRIADIINHILEGGSHS